MRKALHRTAPFLAGIATIAVAGLAGCGTAASDSADAAGAAGEDDSDARAEAPQGLTARAEIRGCSSDDISGTAILRERPSTEGIKLVDIRLEVRGLTDGPHAVHVHETAACEPCGAAGGHHDPGPFGRTTPDAPDFNHPFHGGDLINLEVVDGVGVLETTSSRFTLSPGRLSVFDEDGSALIVHTNPDAYCDEESELEPGCAGGARDACGVLTLD